MQHTRQKRHKTAFAYLCAKVMIRRLVKPFLWHSSERDKTRLNRLGSFVELVLYQLS